MLPKVNIALLVKAGLVTLPEPEPIPHPAGIDAETEALYRSHGHVHLDGRWQRFCVTCGKKAWGSQCRYCYTGRSPELDAVRSQFLSVLDAGIMLVEKQNCIEWERQVEECLEGMVVTGEILKSGEYYRTNRVKFIMSPA